MTDKEKVYIIAEAGINYNGSLDNCYKLIDASVNSGCDCIKFQFFRARDLYLKSAGTLDWKDSSGNYSYDIYGAAKGFELPEEWVVKLMKYCKLKNIDIIFSVFDREGVDFLVGKGLETIKLASYVITNLPLIRYCARTGLSLIMSTGGATLSEVEEAVSAIKKFHSALTLLHCSIEYPTELGDCNLGVIETLRFAFPDIRIGYSDHTREVSDAPVQAVYLGAKVIEKHITLDKKMDGPDHFFALEPEELKQLVSDIRQAETGYKNSDFKINKLIYGNTEKLAYAQEKYLRDFCFMKLYTKRNIKKGEIISISDISILRPGKKEHGLDPKYIELFANYKITAKTDIVCEDPITWSVILS